MTLEDPIFQAPEKHYSRYDDSPPRQQSTQPVEDEQEDIRQLIERQMVVIMKMDNQIKSKADPSGNKQRRSYLLVYNFCLQLKAALIPILRPLVYFCPRRDVYQLSTAKKK